MQPKPVHGSKTCFGLMVGSCGYCGTVDESTELPARPGYYQCNACRKQFTVMVGTVFERIAYPAQQVAHGCFPALRLQEGHQRPSDAPYAWHHLQERLVHDAPPARSYGPWRQARPAWAAKARWSRLTKPIWASVTASASKPDSFVSGFGWVNHPKIETQRKIVALVERGGPARSFVVDSVDKKTVRKILFTNADRKSTPDDGRSPRLSRYGRALCRSPDREPQQV